MALSQRLGWIGVDVGTHTVKLAQAVRDGASVRLHRAAVIQRPDVWSGDDALALEQPITSHPEIRAALECGDFAGRNAICALPMNVCQLRSLNVPPGSDQERRTIIADELAEDWAELRNPMEFDFWEMEPARSGQEHRRVQRERAGGVAAVDFAGLARLPAERARLLGDRRRAAGDGPGGRTGRRLARRAAGAGGRLGIFEHDAVHRGRRAAAVQPADSRLCVRPRAGRDHERVRRHARRSTASGRKRRRRGRAQANRRPTRRLPQAITSAAAGTLDELVRQISRTLQFTETQRRHLQPAAIWLMGGGASMRNVGPYLAEALVAARAHLDARAGSGADCVRRRKPVGRVRQRGGPFGVGLEGSMRTMINLLPAIVPPAANPAQASRAVDRRSSRSCSLPAGAGIGTKCASDRQLSQQLEALSREHAPTQTMLKQLVDMRQQLEELQQQETVAKELECQRNALTLLGVISDTAQKDEGPIARDEVGAQQFPRRRSVASGDDRQRGRRAVGARRACRSTTRPWPSCSTACRQSGSFQPRGAADAQGTRRKATSLRDYEVRCEF